MDNVCHTLVGIAAARAGLNTKTALATATLAIASNLPDIDVLAFATGIPSVALRRGWTHGVLAQALLPLAFAGVMWMVATRGSGLGTRGSRVGTKAVTGTVSRLCTRSMILLIDGSIGLRNIPGATPIRIAMAIVGTMRAHSRGVRSGSPAFLSLVIGP